MTPLTFSGLFTALTEEEPAARMEALARVVTDNLNESAAAITYCTGSGDHHLVANSGYDNRTLDYLLTDFVKKDPGMRVAEQSPHRILTWHDVPWYRSTFSVQNIFAPAGYSEGATVILTAPTGDTVGSFHVSVAQRFMPHWVKVLLEEARYQAASAVSKVAHRDEAALTTRETEVLKLLAQGMSNRAIGTSLHLSTSTVNTHVEHILQKLRSGSRVVAVVRGLELGLIDQRAICLNLDPVMQ